MPQAIHRRSLLRGAVGGAAVSVALPPLEGMFNDSGTAYADGSAIPKRFGFWWWGNGVKRAHWAPKTVGTGWERTEELGPLVDAKLQPWMSIASNYKINHSPFAWVAHHSGKIAMSSGAFRVGSNGYPADAGPTINEVVEQAWKGRTSFGQLNIGISKRGFASSHTSFGEMSPQRLFDTLFGMPTALSGPQAAAAHAQMVKARTSLLDAVIEDARALSARVGAGDKRKLAAHLDTLRAIETRLQQAPIACTPPPRPPADPPTDYSHEDLEGRSKLMHDILHVALACDLSRNFKYVFTGMQVDTVFWMPEIAATRGMHTITHENTTESQLIHHKSIIYTMKMFAYFLSKLATTDVGAGKLLDHCCILATSEQDDGSDGKQHANNNMPILIVGRAGGRLKGGVHYRATTGEITSKAHLTILRALDITADGFGLGASRATDTITALEA